jgi:RHS repeat-associated protein
MKSQQLPSSKTVFFSRVCMVVSLLTLLPLTSIVSNGQDGQRTRGFYPGASYAVSDIDTINTENGNLMLSIPTASLPPGRGGLSAGIGLFYDSKIFDTYSYLDGRYPDGPDTVELSVSRDGGWHYGFQYEFQLVNRYDNEAYHGCNWGDPAQTYVWKVRMKYPDGSIHIFRPEPYNDSMGDDYFYMRPDGWRSYPCSPDGYVHSYTMVYYSVDGTFARLQVQHDSDNNPLNNPWTLYLPDGGRVTGGGTSSERIYDRNNNYVEIQNITYNGHPAMKILDEMNRYLIVEYGPSGGYPEAARDYIYAWRNDENGQLTQLTWTIKWGYSGGTRAYYANPNDVWMGSVYYAPGFVSVSEIDLPTQSGGLSYKFGYDSSNNWGEVSSVTLPSGAKTNYQYSWQAMDNLYTDALTVYPSQKDLVYRPENDQAAGVSSTPCDPATETCTAETWHYSYEVTCCSGPVTIAHNVGPDGGETKNYFFGQPPGMQGNPVFNPVWKSERPDGTMVESLWRTNYPYGCNLNRPGVNPYLKTEFTSIKNAVGTYTKTKIRDYNYDKNGNVTLTTEYDWVDYSAIPHNSYGQVTGLPAGLVIKRVTKSDYYNSTQDASNNSDTPNGYYNSSSPQFRRATKSIEISADGVNPVFRTESVYDNYSTTGNLTQQTSWESTKASYSNPLNGANSISTSNQYDSYGNLVASIDARGTQTTYTYGATNGYSSLYPTQTVTASNYPSIARTTNKEFDFYSGLMTRATDVDNNVASSSTYDVFGRPILRKAAEGKAEETRTRSTYSDVNRRIIVRSDLNNIGDEKLVKIDHYDQLGRLRLERHLEDASTQSATDETVGIKVQTRYAFSGSNGYQAVSNAYRAAFSYQAGSESAMGWKRTKTDNGGRQIEEQGFGGAPLPAPWGSNTSSLGAITTAYDANFTTVTDQAGKARRNAIDGLGRLAQVYEDPSGVNYLTSYVYDAFDNLTTVTQGTQPSRSFAYSSLKRLTAATNPESGTVSYQYDSNGNVIVRSDARGVSAHYAFDVLNRAIRRWYNGSSSTSATTNNSPALPSGVAASDEVNYSYDSGTITNGKGRLASISSSASTYSYNGYDAVGQVSGATQIVGTQNYSLSYAYDRAGHVKLLTYPSGHAVYYSYDMAGRLNDSSGNIAFTGNLGDGVSRTYAAAVRYDAAGRPQEEKFGTATPLYDKQHFNVRGQLADIRLSTSSWQNDEWNWNRGAIENWYDSSSGFPHPSTNGTDNNGNLLQSEVYIPNDDQMSSYSYIKQSYSYDSLNRLTSVAEYQNGSTQTSAQNYNYDRWGNRTINGNTWGYQINAVQTSIDPNTNRLYAPNDPNHTLIDYDATGNQTKDYLTWNGTRTYDAENKMATASNGVTNTYTYDGEGHRVKRKIGYLEVWQVYGLSGEVLAEYAPNAPATSPDKEYGYRNGKLLITASKTDLALGKTATQASTFSQSGVTFVPGLAIDGNTDGAFWHASSATTNYGAQNWWQIDLGASQSIGSIQVWPRTDCCPEHTANLYVLVSDNPFTSTDLNTSLNQSGVSNYWVAGNNATVATVNVNRTGRYVRVQRNDSQYLVLAEVKVWQSSADIEWLVTDHLGTPRMVADATGTLTSIKRHDYLPFGEELFAGQCGRTSQQGYSVNDGVRQKFTQKERDNEIGLDYSVHRYYSFVQGRFTSVDPTLQSINGLNPQTLNRYSYVLNSPLKFIDPFGLWELSYNEVWENGHYVRTEVRITKTRKNDDANSLLKQLGYDPKSKEGKQLLGAISAQLAAGEKVDPTKLGGVVGRAFSAYQDKYTAQVIYNQAHPYKPGTTPSGPSDRDYADCSMTACRIAFPQKMREYGGMTGQDFDVGKASDMLGQSPSAKDGLRTGDVIRYGRDEKTHFVNVLFTDDDGTTQTFSRTGANGPFESLRVNDPKITQLYGKITGQYRAPF